jgi:hypothetical protein
MWQKNNNKYYIKVTKEKSRQTRSLRAFCLANATHFDYK